MSHLDDTCKREAKYSRFVYTDTYAATDKGNPAVDHNSSLKDILCLPQQLSLISIKKDASACNLVLDPKFVDC